MSAAKQKKSAYYLKHKARFQQQNRRSKLLRKYQVSYEEVELMAKTQDYRCKICREPEKLNRALSVDHCHITGKIRGLLCSNCNRALGLFNDDPKRIQFAIEYLLRATDGEHAKLH